MTYARMHSFDPPVACAARRTLVLHAGSVAVCVAGAGLFPLTARGNPRVITWEDLVPKDWDPSAQFKAFGAAPVAEGSAREVLMMREMRKVFDAAPTRRDFDGQLVRLPGFVVPLERKGEALTEMLIVPYFGACIHTPPPPANQIVHVLLAKPQSIASMEAVWVSGRMSSQRRDTEMGVSGYQMTQATTEPYVAPKR